LRELKLGYALLAENVESSPLWSLNSPSNRSSSFNRILVDSGYAKMDDFTNNEFTPDSWWSSSIAFAETISKVAISISLYPTTVTSSTTKKFVGSTKSDKYHYPSCRWTKKIKTENEIWFSSSEDARAHGYVSCGTYRPP
jgi:hypothetical protein